ncbi:6410_t:CDS:1, partial [Scutellospora calospora]
FCVSGIAMGRISRSSCSRVFVKRAVVGKWWLSRRGYYEWDC